MKTIVMNIDGCDIKHETLMAQEYGEEVLCEGWNPQLALARESRIEQQVDKRVYLPSDLAGVDVDAFLKKMYEYQR